MAARRTWIRLAAATAVPAYKPAARTDLEYSPVERGTGATENDPVLRVHPNQVMRPPESTVLRHRSDGLARVANYTDASTLAGADARHTQLSLAQWFGRTVTDSAPVRSAMSAYLTSLRTADALPLSASAKQQISRFESELLPQWVTEYGLPDLKMSQEQWKRSALVYAKQLHLFDLNAFEAHLNHCDRQIVNFFDAGSGDLSNMDQTKAFLEDLAKTLRRDCILKRNEELDALIDSVNADVMQGGQLPWSRFFAAVEGMRSELLDDDAVKARFEVASQHTLPSLKPSVALLFCVVTAAHARAGSQEPKSTDSLASHLHLLSRDDVVAFVVPHLRDVLRNADIAAFEQLGLRSVARQLAVFEASHHTQRQARRVRAEDLAGVFADAAAVETLIARVVDRSDADVAKAHIYQVLGVETIPSSGPEVKKVLERANWKARSRALAIDLLSSYEFVQAMLKVLIADLSAQDKHRAHSGALFTTGTKRQLEEVLVDDDKVRQEMADTISAVQMDLLQDCPSTTLIDLLRAHSVDLSGIEQAAADRFRAARAERELPDHVYASVVREVAAAHPGWASKGVIHPDQDASVSPDSAVALRMLLNIYLRCTYVPSTGAAALAARHRGRIGPIARDPEQTNFEAEVGFAEHYDMFEYKKYDWAGWYQRMVDINNRNVSLRCRLGNLRVLDNRLRPFIDMQTERRLRILAGERVANGVLKLDNDRFEDQKDNTEYGEVKVQELLSEAKKAQLGEEYWPSVEVKVRRPSGQTKMRYSMLDWDRVEEKSKEAFAKYAAKKKTTLFVSPSDTWLKVAGTSVGKTTAVADAEGYTVDTLFSSLGDNADGGDSKQ